MTMPLSPTSIRITRCTARLDEVRRFYGSGLGLPEVAGFADGALFDLPGTRAQLEFTRADAGTEPLPDPQTVLMLYVHSEDDLMEICKRTGGEPGIVLHDPDGFGVVLVPSWERVADDHVTVDWFDGDRAQLDVLFALADDSPVEIASYRERGQVLTANENGAIVGHLQLVYAGAEEVELKSLAVLEDRQRRGIGRRLVARALLEARERGFTTMLVTTASADTEVLRFYQRMGFRMFRVDRDAFSAANGYDSMDVDGIPLRDRVWLSAEL
jgi:ribosomal protein S18 acetylase RimI-like enzyme